eukprot:scaffold2544_cov245-Pinguiococcus_pyrenoidosus.AAC.5
MAHRVLRLRLEAQGEQDGHAVEGLYLPHQMLLLGAAVQQRSKARWRPSRPKNKAAGGCQAHDEQGERPPRAWRGP